MVEVLIPVAPDQVLIFHMKLVWRGAGPCAVLVYSNLVQVEEISINFTNTLLHHSTLTSIGSQIHSCDELFGALFEGSGAVRDYDLVGGLDLGLKGCERSG